MKRRIQLFIVMILMGLSVNAVTLFPYFVDVAGDYKEGMYEELAVLKIKGMYSAKPSFYSNIDEADTFYKDVLPFSSEKIERSESVDKETKVRIVKYMSPMLENKTSVIYLIQIPDKGFFLAYSE